MLLVSLQKLFVLLFIMTTFPRHAKANVIKECVNYTTCNETYGEVYSSLASQKNYFNIALALYPARKPSSVLVHVNLFAFNQTGKSSPVQYTWSMSCLYAAIPAKALGILSLGSILVASRTRELNITIAPFCCNVSEDARLIIIDRVLSELQDLAVSPGIQDPTLNTAECVIEGHKTDIDATGRSPYIRAMLWCSFCFTILFGPLLALISFMFFKNAEEDQTENKEKKQNLAKAVKCTSCFLVFLEIGLLVVVLCFSSHENAPWDIYVILTLISVEGLVMGLSIGKLTKYFPFLPENKCLVKLGIFLWANLTTYHFCWLVVGIMVNTLWGFTVLLVICVVIAATVYSVYKFIYFYEPESWKPNVILLGAIWCSILSLVALVILAGQSFFGKETANEVVKTALLYVTTAFISWLFSKIKQEKSSNTTQGNEADESTQHITETSPV
ncbi:uncharacterized protein LOC144634556 [Oculina patagonica]